MFFYSDEVKQRNKKTESVNLAFSYVQSDKFTTISSTYRSKYAYDDEKYTELRGASVI